MNYISFSQLGCQAVLLKKIKQNIIQGLQDMFGSCDCWSQLYGSGHLKLCCGNSALQPIQHGLVVSVWGSARLMFHFPNHIDIKAYSCIYTVEQKMEQWEEKKKMTKKINNNNSGSLFKNVTGCRIIMRRTLVYLDSGTSVRLNLPLH